MSEGLYGRCKCGRSRYEPGEKCATCQREEAQRLDLSAEQATNQLVERNNALRQLLIESDYDASSIDVAVDRMIEARRQTPIPAGGAHYAAAASALRRVVSPTRVFDKTIGQLDRVLSELMLFKRLAKRNDLDAADKQTLKHHAEDMRAAADSILAELTTIEATPQPEAIRSYQRETEAASEQWQSTKLRIAAREDPSADVSDQAASEASSAPKKLGASEVGAEVEAIITGCVDELCETWDFSVEQVRHFHQRLHHLVSDCHGIIERDVRIELREDKESRVPLDAEDLAVLSAELSGDAPVDFGTFSDHPVQIEEIDGDLRISPLDGPPLPPITIHWARAYSSPVPTSDIPPDGTWWLVEFHDGEPMWGYKPGGGMRTRVHRDSFEFWGVNPVSTEILQSYVPCRACGWKLPRAPSSSEELPIVRGALDAQAEAEKKLAEVSRVLDSPLTSDFLGALPKEAAHQVKRWGTKHDAGKEPQDWFWLLAYLSGKALRAAIDGDVDKAKHHTISSGAVLLNWHRHLSGQDSLFRPGIEPPVPDQSYQRCEATDGDPSDVTAVVWECQLAAGHTGMHASPTADLKHVHIWGTSDAAERQDYPLPEHDQSNGEKE